MISLRRITDAFLLMLVVTGVTHADERVLAAVADTSFFENDLEELSNGQGPYLFAGQILTGEGRRALVQFDLSGIASTATITDAVLTLEMDRTISDGVAMSVHPLQARWGEGGSNSGEPGGQGAPAQPGDATWNFSNFPDVAWSIPGGDFGSASATTVVADNGLYSWSGPGLTGDVQRWVNNPAGNFGWIIIGDPTAGDGSAKRFISRQGDGQVPTLTVTGSGFDGAVVPISDPHAVPVSSLWALLLLAVLVMVGARRFLS